MIWNKKIRELRELTRRSMREAALDAEVSLVTWQRWESGETLPLIGMAGRIEDALLTDEDADLRPEWASDVVELLLVEHWRPLEELFGEDAVGDLVAIACDAYCDQRWGRE